MPFYQWRKSHCGDKIVVILSYLHNGNSYTGIPILHVGSGNEKRSYNVTSSFTGVAHTENDPWSITKLWAYSMAYTVLRTMLVWSVEAGLWKIYQAGFQAAEPVQELINLKHYPELGEWLRGLGCRPGLLLEIALNVPKWNFWLQSYNEICSHTCWPE